ncbi:histidine kinase [Paenibacillus lemnae]|uniref:Histidine kinase n=2 Tax=Paenibacillus lemnae TaxID=1330551 RepID=A0A848MAC9_PAELE|nr:histidine kinase [Paenibacillus lemnae]
MSLQTKFVTTFITLLVIVLGCFLVYVQWFVIQPLQEKNENEQLVTAENVSTQLDFYIASQNQLTQRVLANHEIFAIMKGVNAASRDADKLARSRKLKDVMFSALGPSMNIRDMYVHDLQGNAISSFIGNELSPASLEHVLSDRALREQLHSSYLITRPTSGILSFIRPIMNQNGEVFGYLTVQLDPVYLQKSVGTAASGQVVVLDSGGAVVTSSGVPETEAVPDSLKRPSEENGMYVDRSENYIAYYTSPVTGWTAYSISPKQSVLGPVNSVKYLSIALITALLVFSALYIYISAKNLLLPIRKLRNQLLRIDYSNMNVKVDSRSQNNELLMLDAAFQELMERLQESIENEKDAIREEAAARSSALQAQIAPHFIHNVLYLISVAAQEGKNTVVTEMCKHLSESLRYIVSSPYQHVTLSEELEHTRHYLSLVQQNYEEDLVWEITEHEADHQIQLPRLVIQPIVENCIEHAFTNTDPPWCIGIEVKVYKGMWAIEIRDNGSGFHPEKISSIMSAIQHSEQGGRQPYDPDVGIGNMGLVNTVNRLKLMYKNRLFFNIYNNTGKEGGATVQLIASLTKDFY